MYSVQYIAEKKNYSTVYIWGGTHSDSQHSVLE